jgi:hypothetical protein
MSDNSFLHRVSEEMQKDGLDLLEQVLSLIIGGVLGGKALAVVNADIPLLLELIAYAGLFLIGIVVIGITHFVVSVNRVMGAETDGEK